MFFLLLHSLYSFYYFLNNGLNAFDAWLTPGWYFLSGQRKRYLKHLTKKKKVGVLLGIVLTATSLGTNLAKIVKASKS